jgi:hypothetical protein
MAFIGMIWDVDMSISIRLSHINISLTFHQSQLPCQVLQVDTDLLCPRCHKCRTSAVWCHGSAQLKTDWESLFVYLVVYFKWTYMYGWSDSFVYSVYRWLQMHISVYIACICVCRSICVYSSMGCFKVRRAIFVGIIEILAISLTLLIWRP